jgi:aspartate racemase
MISNKIFMRNKLGIISGMGTRAGLLFLNKLIEKTDAKCDQDFPEFIVHNNSQVPDRTLAIVYNEESPVYELKRSLEMLEKCDVDYIISTCVTSYYFLNQFDFAGKSKILNPIELIAKRLLREYNHVQKIGLLATTGTINSKLFHDKFKNLPFELITLNKTDQEEKFMKSVYMEGGFKSSEISDTAYNLFNEALESLIDKDVELIIGGCTEVQIGIKKANADIEFLDVIDVLVDEVVDIMNLKKIEIAL